MARWVFALQQAIARNFVPPASAPVDLECVVDVRQLPGGTVANVSIGRCNGDDAVRRAIEAAVFKASPLPAPDNPGIFERDLRITFKPEQ
jgi:colicin import membrane protein